MRKAADDELECGKRGVRVAGYDPSPYALAQYLVIRDSFADQWLPQGGIESAMIEMLAVAFSLQLYWSGIAHDRAMRVHDAQRDQLKRYESSGWKSPYQSEADAVDQAHRLADGYNRQFLRVLRQLRDLRRYAPVVIQNAQQVNVFQQADVSQRQILDGREVKSLLIALLRNTFFDPFREHWCFACPLVHVVLPPCRGVRLFS